MKSITIYINETLKLGKQRHKYYPKTKKELKKLLKQLIEERGNDGDFNDINTSEITDMSGLFGISDFNGDISKWDVSNVTNMSYMFYSCEKFNQDISVWDVSNVTNMGYMFAWCESFNQDISKWNVSKVKYFTNIFSFCAINEKYEPKFK